MGFYGFLEVENRQTLSINDDNDLNVGTPLVAFLSIYRSIDFDNDNSPEYQWFAKLESQTDIDLRILAQIFYAGEWNFTTEEYHKFVSSWHSGQVISEDEFKRTVAEIENMWAPIDKVIQSAEEINRLLSPIGEDTYWYSSKDTPQAIRALLNILKRVRKSGGKKVRIQFL